MATIEGLAKSYAKSLFLNRNEKTALEIIEQINALTFKKNSKPIDNDTKNKIIALIKKELKLLGKQKFENSLEERTLGFQTTVASTDTSEFNELITLITKGTK